MQDHDVALEASDSPAGAMDADTVQAAPRRRIGGSIFAVAFGLVIYWIMATGSDTMLVNLGVYPPWEEPMNGVGDNALSLGLRASFMVFSCYLAARLAPRNPLKLALIFGAILFLLIASGAILTANIDPGGQPTWYLIALPLVTLPCAWTGGVLASRYAL
jgi:hypothetical protein